MKRNIFLEIFTGSQAFFAAFSELIRITEG